MSLYTPTLAIKARDMLEKQRADLIEALRITDDVCIRNRARRQLHQVEHALSQPEHAIQEALGFAGPNGWQPAVEDTCAMARRLARPTLERAA